MIMDSGYLFDLKEAIRETPDGIFRNAGLSKEAALGNEAELEHMWMVYQKDIESYGYDPWYAYGDALKKAYNIDYFPEHDI